LAYRIVYAPEATTHLLDLYRYIADASSSATAGSFIDAIIDQCEALNVMPHRGLPREDVRPGLRVLSFRRRVTIAYDVAVDIVTILGVFVAGRDYAVLLEG
jgi:toxin ParE1/3/4